MRDLQAINHALDQARERDDHRAQVGLITAALALPESEPDRAGRPGAPIDALLLHSLHEVSAVGVLGLRFSGVRGVMGNAHRTTR